MLPPLLEVRGRGTSLHLIDPLLSGDTLSAQGYVAKEALRKGRVFRHDGIRYQLLESLEAGTRVVPISLDTPIVLTRRT